MKTLNDIMKYTKSTLDKPLSNIYVEGFITIFLACYAGLILPTLKLGTYDFLRSDMFRIVGVFLVAYLSSHNFTISLVLAVALVMTFNHFNELELNETFDIK
jgi:hypothetical protein